ncbi:hypothetical protein MKK70_18085 [Methylobacterium sp. E-041]|uniref:hypothetical protein n=1 Tax=unclassified Methylobacterium TaxID=2615210 RepID=UPI0011C78B8D|nr:MULTISPECIES: hypothetical protein [unclassified Methylobacterium]MCJ2020905.1 hypothetical protein [Methylobacterium sp. E-065]MCJ2077557.1 hypothetical protein [Methylobacterium sp. E-016]MCJ2107257.1 hypothetical protein [Methylobacterium sp. E-041]MCJ2116153.1 hypothetical protein [Methylobacterium sp. J-001]MCJ2130344.1 hypothetical protein [Methylobacterium sp. E-045]
MPRLTAPPLDFDGFPWRHVGERLRYGHAMALFVMDEAPQTFSDAYRAERGLMVAAVFSWTDRAGTPNLLPCWWGISAEDVDVPALRAAADAAIAKARAARDEANARAEERRLAAQARVDEMAGPIRERLQALVGAAPWQFGRSLTEAAETAHRAEWGPYDLERAERWLSNAEANRVRAEQRIGRPAMPHFYARSEDPAVRAATLEGLRYLASLDEDWAAIQNGEGFSQTTTWSGHVLAEREVLDRGEAAHGLALIYQHRLQLPDELCERALGEAPVRRGRRRLPAGDLLAPA